MNAELNSLLPEMVELERILNDHHDKCRIKKLGHISCQNNSFPLYSISIGSQDPLAPSLGIFGGVHGLERIGTQVVLSYLRSVLELSGWDKTINSLLESSRLVFFPLVNPGGMYLLTRSNPNGVDLMRNAPVQADKVSPYALYAGHRISSLLPWYRGRSNTPMEVESQALCELVRSELLCSKISLALDVHSGFGARDRLWFPYARTKKAFPNIAEVVALKRLLDKTYPNHVYIVEPQAKQYVTNGDLWDYLYDEAYLNQKSNDKIFIPLTLEMGSWIWTKKDWRQIFSPLGPFNPMKPHRIQRTLRRHLLLLDFLHRATRSFDQWLPNTEDKKNKYSHEGQQLWWTERTG